MDIFMTLKNEFKLNSNQLENTVKLIDEGNTIPFIARYRKELTGSLDDQVLRELNDRLEYLRGLEKRREDVFSAIENQGNMNEEIKKALECAVTLSEIDDIYRPFRPKRKTRASMAVEKGLQPLADLILEQKNNIIPNEEASFYINEEKGILSVEEAISGASDIIAETVSDNAAIRKSLREYIQKNAKLVTKAANAEEDSVYKMYYEFEEPVSKIAGHRVLAIDRGEKEDFLKVKLDFNNDIAVRLITEKIVTSDNLCSELVTGACHDGYSRLILPSLEREIRGMLTEKAGEQAIKVFSANLRQLLMQPPVKNNVILGLDPAYRTGCKIAVVSDTGCVLDTAVIYPTPPQNKIAEAKEKLMQLIKMHNVTVISIGNGTASRESEVFVAELLRELPEGFPRISYMVVSEAGASVYSASKLAAEEFPEFDVSLRSAVSIARRLQDPLAELVKIDPKSVGVGQYQHDMAKKRLDEALSGVVENCVNSVGVDLNTASYSLLSYIAGINAGLAKNIVAYREENGAFTERKQLLKVPKLGKKAFEQCAGFLRVPGGANVLDNTAVHPESYESASHLLSFCGYSLCDVENRTIGDLNKNVMEKGFGFFTDNLGIGEPTIKDIISELGKPGRDPRDELPKPLLRSDVLDIKDLKRGMELNGTVRNVIDFGIFVDIGVHEDGLVHISQICDRYIKHPMEIVKVGDIVKVWVLDTDVQKKRISLTMKSKPE